MAKVTVSKSVKLQAGADEVWTFVSDFSAFPSWQPQISSVEMLPNGDRRVFFKREDSILDRVTRLDPANRAFNLLTAVLFAVTRAPSAPGVVVSPSWVRRAERSAGDA